MLDDCAGWLCAVYVLQSGMEICMLLVCLAVKAGIQGAFLSESQMCYAVNLWNMWYISDV